MSDKLYGYKVVNPENMVRFLPETKAEKRARFWRTVEYYAWRIPILFILIVAIAAVCSIVGAPAYIAGILGFTAFVRVFS